jgi:hypothetical protein
MKWKFIIKKLLNILNTIKNMAFTILGKLIDF